MNRPFILVIFVATIYLTNCFAQSEPLPNPPVSPLLATPTRHLVPTYTPTATFTPTPLPLPTVVNYFKFVKTKPICTSKADYLQCYDAILDISFEYPIEWGTITATLGSAVDAPNNSGFAGYGYSYLFSYNFDEPHLNGFTSVVGSGRSIDFSEPRDGWVGDFAGFREKTTDTFCENFPSSSLCEVIKPGIVLVFLFAKAQELCDSFPGLPPFAEALYVNLPHRRLVNGFVFAYPFLSVQQEKSLYTILGIGQTSGSMKCNNERAQRQFDEQVRKLADEISSRTASEDIMQNVNAFIRLANSIEGQETSR